MSVSLIVAVADSGVIGRDGQLPWHLSSDLKRFKRLTMGHALVMGRRTYESIGRPLPGRETFVLTRREDFQSQGVHVVGDLATALQRAAAWGEVFVIGGAEVFREALPLAGRIYLTRVHADVEGDVTFDDPPPDEWRLVERSEHASDARNSYATSFEVYERRAPEA
ncbi:MAG: dihydrofolate reductase [Pirellulales bacterium]